MTAKERIYKADLNRRIIEIRRQQRELEKRYNHYHNPLNGQFASGRGGGEGLFYSMGKGKGGAVVGASSKLENLFRTEKNGQMSFF